MRVEHPACNDDHAKNIRSRTIHSAEVEERCQVFPASLLHEVDNGSQDRTEVGVLQSLPMYLSRERHASPPFVALGLSDPLEDIIAD
jgi:hypothetical protein